MDFMIELKNIYYEYNVFEEKIKVLNGLNLKLREKEVVLIRGESGCGKSTLSKIICGIYKPTSGDILYNGKKVSSSFLQKRTVCLNPKYSYIENLTVMQNLILCLDSFYSKKEIEKEIMQVLDSLGIKSKHSHKFKTLSSGEKQRVLIAYALLVKCEVLVLDEITQSLNKANAILCLKLLENVKANCLIYISHKEDVIGGITKKLEFKDKKIEITTFKEEELRKNKDFDLKTVHCFSRLGYWIKAFYKSFIIEFLISMLMGLLVIFCITSDAIARSFAAEKYVNSAISLYQIIIPNEYSDFDYKSLGVGYRTIDNFNGVSAKVYGRSVRIEKRTIYSGSVDFGREIEAPGEVLMLVSEHEVDTIKHMIGRKIYLVDSNSFFNSPEQKDFPLEIVGVCVNNGYSRKLLIGENNDSMFYDFFKKTALGIFTSQGGKSYFRLSDIIVDNSLEDYVVRQSIDKKNPYMLNVYHYKQASITIESIYDDSGYGVFMNQFTFDTLLNSKTTNASVSLCFDNEKQFNNVRSILDDDQIEYTYGSFLFNETYSTKELFSILVLLSLILIVVEVFYIKRNHFMVFIKGKKKHLYTVTYYGIVHSSLPIIFTIYFIMKNRMDLRYKDYFYSRRFRLVSMNDLGTLMLSIVGCLLLVQIISMLIRKVIIKVLLYK